MLRICVDFNCVEDIDKVVIRTDIEMNESLAPTEFHENLRVVIYEDDLECEAILRPGKIFPWMAQIIPGTFRDVD